MNPRLPLPYTILLRMIAAFVLVAWPSGIVLAQAGDALFVVANTSIGQEDSPLYNVLEGLEYQIEIVQDVAVTAGDADGKAVVLISESVASGNVLAKFNAVSVPVVTLEGFIQDDMFLTGQAQDVDYGFAAGAGTVIMATASGHPVMGGLPAGPVPVYEASGAMQWGIPVPSATILATMPDDAERATLYVLEPGAELGDGSTAPARRAFYGGLHSSAGDIVSETGLFLLANIVLWASGREDEIIPIEGDLTAFFTATPSSGFAPLTVEFDASGSASPGTITSFEWDFGDGSTGDGSVVSHEYTDPGDYSVTLTVTDDQGGSASLTSTVFVGEPVSFEPHFTIPFTAAAPEIDGEMESLWDGAVSLSIANHVNDSPPTSEEDLSATVYVLYDQEHLYVLYDVMDDDLQNDSVNSWEDDAVDLYLDGGLQKCFRCYDADDAQFEFSWNSDVVTGNAANGPLGENVTYAWQTTDAGYIIEARVPWANFGIDPVEGTVIGIEFMVNDDDGGGTRNTKLAWFAEVDETYQWAHLMGNAALGVQSVSSEGAPELPTRLSIESVYPNPFNPRATAVLAIREAGEHEVRVYNVLGALVRSKILTAAAPGRMEVPLEMDGLSSGVYVVSVRSNATGKTAYARAMLLK